MQPHEKLSPSLSQYVTSFLLVIFLWLTPTWCCLRCSFWSEFVRNDGRGRHSLFAYCCLWSNYAAYAIFAKKIPTNTCSNSQLFTTKATIFPMLFPNEYYTKGSLIVLNPCINVNKLFIYLLGAKGIARMVVDLRFEACFRVKSLILFCCKIC